MIKLTSLKGETFYINIDRIEKMEVHSDTILTQIDGKVVRVMEDPETIIQLIVEFRRRIQWR
jgi:flagellar protein FlbD